MIEEYETYGFKIGDIVIHKGAKNYDEKRRIIGVLGGKTRASRCDSRYTVELVVLANENYEETSSLWYWLPEECDRAAWTCKHEHGQLNSEGLFQCSDCGTIPEGDNE